MNKEVEKVKQIELVLLREFLRVCQETGLHCYADGGTLLGAVRHKGFIPWDDDIDIAMFRKDYDRLVQVAPAFFKQPFFFQCTYTDKGYFRGHAQLRMDGTLAALKKEYTKVPFHQGVFIDIFPLDTVPPDNRMGKKQWKLIQRYKHNFNVLWGIIEEKGTLYRICKKSIQFFGKVVNRHKLFAKFESVCRRFDGQTDDITLLSFNTSYRQRLLKRSWYKETIMIPFENLLVPVPIEYEKVLEAKYGNWRIPCNQDTMHGDLIYKSDLRKKEE